MSEVVNNQNLKERLELLTKKAFALYNRVLNQYQVGNNFLQMVPVIVQLEAEIKKIDEFQTCLVVSPFRF